VSLVEPAGALVLLEHPQLEALGPEALRVVEQCRAEATILGRRVRVEMGELVVADPGEPDHLPLFLRDPDLRPREKQCTEPRPDVVGNPRQVGHLVTRAREQAADRRCVVESRASDHPPSLGATLEADARTRTGRR
jgi:hypothetical protein